MSGAGQLNDVSKDTQLIVYCRTGSRSNAAIQILKQLGFTNLANGINKDHVEAKYNLDR
jgi:rhodanese-related sulfurtransferase